MWAVSGVKRNRKSAFLTMSILLVERGMKPGWLKVTLLESSVLG